MPAYKKYAEDNNLQVDDYTIFDVCNADHISQQLCCYYRTIDCTCGCDYGGDDVPKKHTFTFGDKRCSYGIKVILCFINPDEIGLIGNDELPAYVDRY